MPTFLYSYDYNAYTIDEEIKGVKLQKARERARHIVISDAIRKYDHPVYGYYPTLFVFKEDSRGGVEPVGHVSSRFLKFYNSWDAVWYPVRANLTNRDRAGYVINPDGSLQS